MEFNVNRINNWIYSKSYINDYFIYQFINFGKLDFEF